MGGMAKNIGFVGGVLDQYEVCWSVDQLRELFLVLDQGGHLTGRRRGTLSALSQGIAIL